MMVMLKSQMSEVFQNCLAFLVCFDFSLALFYLNLFSS